MGMFGNSPMRPPGDFVQPQGAYGLPQVSPQMQAMGSLSPATAAPRSSFLAPGGTGRTIAGIIGDALLGAAGRPGVYAPAANERSKQNEALQRALSVAQFKADNHPDTPIIANAKAIGLIPGTPEFTKFVTDAQMKQGLLVLGSADTGQTVVDPNALRGGMGGFAQSGRGFKSPADQQMAITALRADPSLASQYDEVFGPGAAARALGGQ